MHNNYNNKKDLMRRYLAQAIVSVGLVTLSAAKEVLSISELANKFLSNLNLEQTAPEQKATFQVVLDYK
jgi:hypothetical protein